MKQPLVSILTTSFNHARWLPDCLNSVRMQTYPFVEHVVIDDGSTDGSQELLQRTGTSIIWASQPNSGQSAAANRALAASHGDIIGWLNSDDAYFGPNVVAEVVDLFVRRPDVDVVYGHAALINNDDLVLHLMWVPPFSKWLLKNQSFIIQSTAFIRRSALKAGFLDESFDYAMDRELWLRLARSSKFARLPKILAIDRYHLSRKTLTMRSLGRTEEQRLRLLYGCKPRAGSPVFKLWHIISRFVGLGLIAQATKGPFAFSAVWDGPWKIVVRQIAIRKAWMPTGL